MPDTMRIARRGGSGSRSGFSLTELLIASAIALVIMTGVASLFGVLGATVSQSQAIAALNGRLRSTAWQLRQDLTGVTVDLVPWTRPESNSGYFELLEGPQRDATLALASGGASNVEGDTDDTLLFTTRAVGGPFVGRYDTGTIESDCAEVAWFCREMGTQPISGTSTKFYNLYRRQLLVMNYVGRAPFFNGTAATSVPVANLVSGATPLYDLSLRLDGAGQVVPNSLADLTKRENRCFLGGNASIRSGTFPFAVLNDGTARLAPNATFDNTDRVWEDVILTNVIAFDVRVFDPAARAQTGTVTNLYPGDPGYAVATAVSGTGASGAYVDLGWGGGSPTAIASAATWPPSGTTAFQTAGVQVRNAGTNNTLPVTTYDTWSLHYEFNGVDEDGDGVIDDGTDGADNNGNGVPDDPAEYETSPPYPVPLRGIEVRIRCYEPTSKEIRQITVRHTFVKK
jgi:prepilin-type N-terminal cleavage/methylation domain-containing protein